MAVRGTMGIFRVMYSIQPKKRFTRLQHHLTKRQHSLTSQHVSVFRHHIPPPALTRAASDMKGAKATRNMT